MDEPELDISVEGDKIIVALSSTRFAAAYQKSPDSPGLVQASDWTFDDQDATITRQEFLVQSWKAANAKARELGWIV